ncbi:MAG: hypothetical protein ACR2LR_28825 [Hassallia sp.]
MLKTYLDKVRLKNSLLLVDAIASNKRSQHRTPFTNNRNLKNSRTYARIKRSQ